MPRDRKENVPVHTMPIVYREMLLQIARDYSGLPDIRTLTNSEIRFFYEGLRPELQKATKPVVQTQRRLRGRR